VNLTNSKFFWKLGYYREFL